MTRAAASISSAKKPPRFVSYLGVSTDNQGTRGLGVMVAKSQRGEAMRVMREEACRIKGLELPAVEKAT